jgi:hypothetical protein
MQENSTVSITTLIICTLPSCAASSQAIAKPLRDVGRKVAAAILNPGGIRFPPKRGHCATRAVASALVCRPYSCPQPPHPRPGRGLPRSDGGVGGRDP